MLNLDLDKNLMRGCQKSSFQEKHLQNSLIWLNIKSKYAVAIYTELQKNYNIGILLLMC